MDNYQSRSKSFLFAFLTLCLLMGTFKTAVAQTEVNDRAKWFVEDRFGMFIHWGLYSATEGIWKGEHLRYDNDYAEWIFYRNRIDKEDYLQLLKKFDWEKIDPEQWVLLAKEAGMKYITITSKHHDGFALWDSKVSDYNISQHTSPKRDIIKELAAACKKHGIKLGLYYSHWIDWEDPNGWDHTKEVYKISDTDYNHYWQTKVIPQITELLTNYGEISLLWFDMWYHHSQSIIQKKQLLQLKKLIRELQPNCIVNSRLGLSIEEDADVDFKTLGDNQLGNKKEEFPWQSPGTIAHSWGFNSYEKQWKSTTTILHWLINNVSLNGNYMLNIGPRANGDVPYEITQRLEVVGKWLQINGASIYGAGAYDLDKNQNDWGKITCKKEIDGKTKLFLHLYNWPLNKKLNVTGITDKPSKVYLLADASQTAIKYKHQEAFTELQLPYDQPDPMVSVIVMEYDSYPQHIDGLVSKNRDNGYALTVTNCLNKEGSKKMVKAHNFGSTPKHIKVNKKSQYDWRIYVDKPGKLSVDISYSYQGKEKGKITVSANKQTVKAKIQNSGIMIAEPRSPQLENFKCFKLKQLEFDKPGYYDITLKVDPPKDKPLNLQWLWLEQE